MNMKFPFDMYILYIMASHIQMNSIEWFNTTFKGLNAWLAVVSVDHGNLNKLFTGSCAKKIQATR